MVAYNFYQSEYCGTSIPVEEWQRYALEATAQLRRYQRIYTVTAPDEPDKCPEWAENMAICAMADVSCYFEAAQNGDNVTSSTIGSVSSSYGGSAAAVDLSRASREKELLRAARLYLDIYRGVGRC
nr:MAG TPA: Head Tail Connector Protein [Caudoviricetes sp.]